MNNSGAVGIQLLNEVKESIINAYETKTGLSRVKLAHMMDAETWISAHKAIELGFADRILYETSPADDVSNAFMFDTLTVTNTLAQKLPKARQRLMVKSDEPIEPAEEPQGIPVDQFYKRLNLLKRLGN